LAVAEQRVGFAEGDAAAAGVGLAGGDDRVPVGAVRPGQESEDRSTSAKRPITHLGLVDR
jgi:hypothetical protein